MKNLMIVAAIAALSCYVSFAAKDEMAVEGGLVSDFPKDAGAFVIVNAQSRVAENQIGCLAQIFRSQFSINIKTFVGKPVDPAAAAGELAKLGAKGGIWIVDRAGYPLSLGAVEDGWGILNVSPIFADKPDAAKANSRFLKAMLRLFASIHGIGDPTSMPGCVMKPGVGVKGLDDNLCDCYSPEAVSKVGEFLAFAGYKQGRTATYLEACQEGWAPSPTNDVQRKIWKEVHTIPDQPIQIKP